MFSWIIKNILISGCVIFPISFSCLENLSYVNIGEIKNFEISSESWSKDWPNRADKNIEMIDFNKDFNWINDWYNNHFKIIIKKIIPYILLILTIITYTLLKFGINKNKINEKFLKKLYINFFKFFI